MELAVLEKVDLGFFYLAVNKLITDKTHLIFLVAEHSSIINKLDQIIEIDGIIFFQC